MQAVASFTAAKSALDATRVGLSAAPLMVICVPSTGGRDVAELAHKTAELLARPFVAKPERVILDAVKDALHARVNRVMAALVPLLDAQHLRLQAAKDEHPILRALLAHLDTGAFHTSRGRLLPHPCKVALAQGLGSAQFCDEEKSSEV